MRYKIPQLLLAMLLFLSLSSISLAADPKIDTSSEETYNKSLTEIYTSLSSDKQWEFTAFFDCIVQEGQKILPRIDILEDGLEGNKSIYFVVQALEADNKIKINGLTAKEVIATGKQLLSSNLEKQISETTDETALHNLTKQLELIKKPDMSHADFEEYHKIIVVKAL